MRRSLGRKRGRGNDEGGFSLVEVVVAITVAGAILTGGAQALASALQAAVFARSNTQSAEILSETIESLRSLDQAAVAMVASDLASDPAIGGTNPNYTFDPDGSGPLAAEPIALAATGTVNPHVEQVTRNDQEYTVRTYVTVPTDASVVGAAYKRVTVRVSWVVGTRAHERQSSTVLTATRRGLPLPNFQVVGTNGTATAPITANTGSALVLAFDVVNRGARDTFDLQLVSSPATTATFTFHEDTGSMGVLEAADPEATDTSGNVTVDTGALQVDETMSLLATATVPSTLIPGRYTFTLTAVSVAQPAAGGASRSATFAVDVVSDSACAGCTYRPVYLRNVYPACAIEPCSSVAQATMPLRAEAPTATSLANFDTDNDLGPGRRLLRSLSTPASTTTDVNYAATWRYATSAATTLSGDVVVDLKVAVAGAGTAPGSSLPVGVHVYVSRSTNGSGSAIELLGQGSASYGAVGTTDFHPMRVRVPVSSTVANNRFVEIKVVVDTATSLTNVWLAYDSTTDPAVAYLPVA